MNTGEPILASVETEEALIGCVMIDPDQYRAVNLKADMFYVHRHQMIWLAIGKLLEAEKYPDIVLIADELEKIDQLSEVDGIAGLSRFLTMTSSSLLATDYAKVIRENHTRRSLLNICQELARSTIDTRKPLETTISEVVHKLTTVDVADTCLLPISDILSKVYDDFEYRTQNPNLIYGIKTGFADFDQMMGGLNKTELMYIAGAPGIGKSKLAWQLAINLANPDIGNSPGVIFSLEMSALSLGYRAVSSMAKVPTDRMKSGELRLGDWDVIIPAFDKLSNMPVQISTDSFLSIDAMRSELYRAKTRFGAKWFLLDYLALLRGYENLRDDNLRLSSLSRDIKQFCLMFDMAGIAINAVTKAGMDGGDPRMSDMRGPSQVMHDADIIAFLVDDEDHTGCVDIVFRKVRDHSIKNRIVLRAERDYPAFTDTVIAPAASSYSELP